MGTTDVERRSIVLAFCEECVWVYCLRQHFRDLYEISDKRRQLLGEVAGLFFQDMNAVLIEYLFLQYCKLTDPANSGKEKHNLTSNYILGLDWKPEVSERLAAANNELLQFRLLVLDARRKLIAHLDLRSRIGSLDMGAFTPTDEQRFWTALQEFASVAHEEVTGSPFEVSVTIQDGDVASLIHSLRDAVDYDDLVKDDDGFLLARLGKRRYDDA